MKKNFLMVASLLIAAMLLVVSCSQEVKAPVDDNGLIKVSLNTSAARSALTYSGMKISDVSYRYKLTAQWTPTGDQDTVVGNTDDFVTFDNDGTNTTQDLGYVSQGLWKVEVIGSALVNGVAKNVLKGETQVYFNKNNGSNTVTVYVKPIDTASSAQIGLEVKVNDHDAGTNYRLYYSIESVSGVNVVSETLMDKENSLDDYGYRLWKKKATGLTPGYYRVTVALKNGSEIVGGLTTGVLLFSGDTDAKLTGSVNSKDFIDGTLNVYYPEVKVSIDSSDVTKSNGVYSVTYTAGASVTGDNNLSANVTPTYTWYENGSKVASTSENNSNEFVATYNDPGYKTVTCVVTYTLSVPNKNVNTGDTSTVEFVVQGAKDLTQLVDETTVATTTGE